MFFFLEASTAVPEHKMEQAGFSTSCSSWSRIFVTKVVLCSSCSFQRLDQLYLSADVAQMYSTCFSWMLAQLQLSLEVVPEDFMFHLLLLEFISSTTVTQYRISSCIIHHLFFQRSCISGQKWHSQILCLCCSPYRLSQLHLCLEIVGVALFYLKVSKSVPQHKNCTHRFYVSAVHPGGQLLQL